MTTIEITVQSGSIKEFGSKRFTLKTTDTVRTLREMVAKEAGVPVESIRLVHSASLLSKDDALLEEFPNITKSNVMFTTKMGRTQASTNQTSSAASPLPPQPATLTSPMPSQPIAVTHASMAQPPRDAIQHLIEVTRRSESMVRLALSATNNNVNVAAMILMEFNTEKDLQDFVALMNSPQTALSNQVLENILSDNPVMLNQFTATVGIISPDLAARFNSDRSLLLDVFRLVLYITSSRHSRTSVVPGASMGDVGSSMSTGSRPRQASDDGWTEQDDINMAQVSEVVGQDLNMDRVKELYLRLDRNMDALLSAIFEQPEGYYR